LLIQAIRYGEEPEVKSRLTQIVSSALDQTHIQDLLEERALVHDAMDASKVSRIREEMERAEARRLQPHYIESFFFKAFEHLGGSLKQREPHRYEITNVPGVIRNRDRIIGHGAPVVAKYERIVFDKPLITPPGQTPAAFVCPGHPLLSSVTDLILERNRDLLRRGTVLVDDRDSGTEPRVLFFLEHSIQDANLTKSGERRVISRRMLYVELEAAGNARSPQYAPYLDYRPLKPDEPIISEILKLPECTWITKDIEKTAQAYAISKVVPEHLKEVRSPKLELIAKTEQAVKDRLVKEINYWDHRASELDLQEKAGKVNARLNSSEARKRADNLQERLQKRLADLELEKQISALPPFILGSVLVIPVGLLAKITGKPVSRSADSLDKLAAAARAREIIMKEERRLGFKPTDREMEKLGYDIESKVPGNGKLRFLEVKARITGADVITVTRNEILYSLNKPEDFILAIVEFFPDDTHRVRYLREPFHREPDFGVTSVNYDFADLMGKAEDPR
jgi:hypothetical protein